MFFILLETVNTFFEDDDFQNNVVDMIINEIIIFYYSYKLLPNYYFNIKILEHFTKGILYMIVS